MREDFLYRPYQMHAPYFLIIHRNRILPKDFLSAMKRHFQKIAAFLCMDCYHHEQNSATENHQDDHHGKPRENGLELHQHPLQVDRP